MAAAAPGHVEVFCRVLNRGSVDADHWRVLPELRAIEFTRYRPSAVHGTRRTLSTGARQEAVTQRFTLDGMFYSGRPDGSSGAGAGQRATPSGGPNAQSSVYDTAVRRCVAGADGVVSGVSATVLCCGARGTGKSSTLFGRSAARGSSTSGGGGGDDDDGDDDNGVAWRAFRDVFHAARQAAAAYATCTHELRLSVVQLQGNAAVDLLAEDGDAGGPAQGRLCATADDALAALGAALRRHSSSHGAPSLHAGGRRRLAGAPLPGSPTRTRSTSCFCHLIVSLHVQQRRGVDADGGVETRRSVLHLVDLASSGAADGAADRLAAGAAAQSRAALEDVLTALGRPPSDAARAGTPFVPYRHSRLTTILRGALGGRSRTVVIAHVDLSRCGSSGCGPTVTSSSSSAAASSCGGTGATARVDDTLRTLLFVRRCRRVTVAPTATVVVDAATQVRELQRQVVELRGELQLQVQLRTSTSAPSAAAALVAEPADDVGSAPAAALSPTAQQRMDDFLCGQAPSLRVETVREVQSYFAALRALLREREGRVAKLTSEVEAARASGPAAVVPPADDSSGGGSGEIERRRPARRRASSRARGSFVSVAFAADARPPSCAASVLDAAAGVSCGCAAGSAPAALAAPPVHADVPPPILRRPSAADGALSFSLARPARRSSAAESSAAAPFARPPADAIVDRPPSLPPATTDDAVDCAATQTACAAASGSSGPAATPLRAPAESARAFEAFKRCPLGAALVRALARDQLRLTDMARPLPPSQVLGSVCAAGTRASMAQHLAWRIEQRQAALLRSFEAWQLNRQRCPV